MLSIAALQTSIRTLLVSRATPFSQKIKRKGLVTVRAMFRSIPVYRWGNILHVYLLMWMSQVVVRVVEPAMERVPEIVMVAIVCQSLNPSHKQVHMKYVSPPIHGEWHETLHARSPDPSALFFARRV